MKATELKKLDDQALGQLLAGIDTNATGVQEGVATKPDKVAARLCDGGGTCIALTTIS